MSIKSINEPDGPGHTTMLMPMSINEPPTFEAPEITDLDPVACDIGSEDFTLYVHGTGFLPVSVIHFAGHDEPTTLNADGSLSTGVKPTLWTDPVVVQVQVKNGDLLSNAVDFSFDGVEVQKTGHSRETSRGRHGHAGGHGRGGRHRSSGSY